MRTVKSCEMWIHVKRSNGMYTPVCKTSIEYEGDNIANLHQLVGVPMRDEDKAWESVVKAATQAQLRLNVKARLHFMDTDGLELPVH